MCWCNIDFSGLIFDFGCVVDLAAGELSLAGVGGCGNSVILRFGWLAVVGLRGW